MTLLPASKPNRRLEDLLFLALLAAHVVTVWTFRYFPSQDGPAHLENAAILRDYHDPGRPLLRTFYQLNTNPKPNWFSHLLLAGLLNVAPPLVAEKVLLTLYWTLLPLAVRYAVRSVRHDAGYLAVLAFPFADNLFLHMGFYNFCFSLAFWFLVVGYWLRHRERFTVSTTLVLTCLVMALYSCHLVAVLAAGLTVGLGVAWQRFRPRAILPFAAFVPAVVLGAWFVWRQAGVPVKGEEATLAAKALGLVQLEDLVSFSKLEGLVSMALGAGLWLVAAVLLVARVRSRRPAAGDEMLLCVAAFIVVYLLAPDATAGGSFLYMRLGLFPYFALILWLAAQPVGPRLRWGMQFGATAASLLLLALHVEVYQQVSGLLDEYLSCAGLIEPETTLLSISYDHTGHGDDGKALSVRVGPFRHAAGYIAAERGVIDLLNYEAGTGYFPVRFNPAVSPVGHLGGAPGSYGDGLLDQPPRVDIAAYTRQTGQTVDYVILWGRREGQAARDVLTQIEAGYERVSSPTPRGLVQLYRRKLSP
jgi:hypothetical protein